MSRKRDKEGGEPTWRELLDKSEEENGVTASTTTTTTTTTPAMTMTAVKDKDVELVIVENQEEDGEDSHNHDEDGGEKRQLLLQGIQVESRNTSGAGGGSGSGSATTTATCQSSSSTTTAADEEKEDFNSDVYLPRKQYYYVYSNQDEGNVKTASLTLLLVIFNLLWSCALSYWYFHLDYFEVAVSTLVIILVSGSITAMCFFTTRASASARRNLWSCSKFAWLVAAVPCLIPAILSAFYFISSVLDKATQLNRNALGTDASNSSSKDDHPGQCANFPGATRKTKDLTRSSGPSPPPCSEEWRTGSAPTFLIESLTLCFPLAVFHLCVLLEDPNSIPSLIGLYTLFGIFILSFSITFSRFHYDCLSKKDRFGEGTEKYLRFCYLWSAKIIWLVTFAILVVTARMRFPEWKIEATIGASVIMIAVHEIPLWICLLPHCGKLAAKVSSLFFLIPQFTSLISLIYWVNTDPMIYHTNMPSIVLGVYFWSETVMLCGWLVDGSTEKDVDLVPLYPHFFGDVISSCFPEESLPPTQAMKIP